MEASAAAIEAARRSAPAEDAFDSAMDDMMWYRNLAYEFFAGHDIPVITLDGRRPLDFVVDGEVRRFMYDERTELDVIVAYAPQYAPLVIAPIDLQTDPDPVLRLLRATR